MTGGADGRSLSLVAIALTKGILYRDREPSLWQSLFALQARVREYFAVLGLELVVDETEGYAFLRQQTAGHEAHEALEGADPATTADGGALPRVVHRRPLTYPVSLLLALLRRKLAEADANAGDTRVVLTRGEIVDLLRVFLPAGANEAKLVDRIDVHINKVVELGFLHGLKGRDDAFEVRRILKAFVDGQWLLDFERRLAAYAAHVAGEQTDDAAR